LEQALCFFMPEMDPSAAPQLAQSRMEGVAAGPPFLPFWPLPLPLVLVLVLLVPPPLSPAAEAIAILK